MALVATKLGEIERERLTWTMEFTEDENQIVTTRNWYLDGQFVRNDVWVSLHRGLGTALKVGALPGA